MRITVFFLSILFLNAKGQSRFEVTSPNGDSQAVINLKDTIRIEVKNHSNVLLKTVAAIKVNQAWLGIGSKLVKVNRRSVAETIIHPTPTKRKVIPDEYNELELQFKEKFSFIIRLYNDEAAYRFVLNMKDTVIIQNEISDYVFDPENVAFIP